MFNSKVKKEAIAAYELEFKRHESEVNTIVKNSEKLQDSKEELKLVIEKCWTFLNSMKKKPVEVEIKIEKIRLEFKKFENTVLEIKSEFDKNFKTSAGVGAAGAAAGVGVAALGPSAAMAVAMTFGTASTGTAISALGGAAATNAALAWLGGGAIVAGGGGMTAGSTMLALAGPIGWAIGGTAIAGAGLMANSKNKKVASEAFDKANELKTAIAGLQATNEEITKTNYLTVNTNVELVESYYEMINESEKNDYDMNKMCSGSSANETASFINQVLSAAQLINRPIGAKA